ncbi:MAG: TRAP transporter permease [Acidiferrobacterales bacterium]
MAISKDSLTEPAVASGRYRRFSAGWQVFLLTFTCLAVYMAVNQLFNLGFFVGHVLLDNHYHYALIALFLPLVFLLFPAYPGAPQHRVPWYDALLAVCAFVVLVFFFVNSQKILDLGWEFGAPDYAVYASCALWLLVLEGARRAGGTALFVIVAIVSLYPIYADKLPGPISGLPSSLGDAAAYHAMSNESMLGIPMQALANLVIGFLIFGVALQHTGGGKFFLNLAFALLGHVRGGPAKVAIFASGLMGSMSGSVISNVVTTGVMTIPAMQRTGLSRPYSGGVEACASTGGVLMPPIMGATAFIMAVFLEIPYIHIAVAAIIPSILYFFGLFVQIDAHAARMHLPGLPREELPRVGQTMREGWHFVAVFVLLIVMLVLLKREVLAPFYATALLIAINQVASKERWGWNDLKEFVGASGRLLAEITAILAAVGLIIGALSVTGMAGTLVNDLVFIAGGNTLILLLMGAITSFIMGIGMTVTAAYVLLAIVLAPALIQGGLDPMAVHLFILYWGMVSYITPPVALGAFAAAAIAHAKPMRTGLEAMRLGSIIYFVPFFFVLDPAFILRAPWLEIAPVAGSAFIGVVLVASALQGYLVGAGNLATHPVLGWPIRALILAGGLLIAVPGGGLIPFTNIELAVAAVALAGPAIALARWFNHGQMIQNVP